MRTLAAAVVVLAGLSAPVLAQPGPDTVPEGPATAAPTTEPWSNVSHINGQLVPVGDRNDYLLKNPKRFNIATNPIGWLVGFYGVSVSAAVTDNIALRGNVEYFDYDFFGHTTGQEIGISAPIYLRRTFSGPFLEPGFIYRATMDTPWNLFGDDNPTPVAHTYAGPEVLFGWQWMFDSGLNIAAAFGVTRNLDTTAMTDSSGSTPSNDPEPTGYLRIGYAF